MGVTMNLVTPVGPKSIRFERVSEDPAVELGLNGRHRHVVDLKTSCFGRNFTGPTTSRNDSIDFGMS